MEGEHPWSSATLPSSSTSADGGHSWSLAVVPSDPAPFCISRQRFRVQMGKDQTIPPCLHQTHASYIPFSRESLCAADVWGEGRQGKTQRGL